MPKAGVNMVVLGLVTADFSRRLGIEVESRVLWRRIVLLRKVSSAYLLEESQTHSSRMSKKTTSGKESLE